MRRYVFGLSFFLAFLSTGEAAQKPANLLRNADFQDDSITQIPQNKDHHWCYSSDFYNRPDYNPDTWVCKGSWQWLDADAPPGALARTKIHVAGLKAGSKIRVLFEEGELTAAKGFFTDDFRGQDLYQRYGGGFWTGYGDTPVALHIYEMGTP
jgi:hypothetical protein